MGKNICNNRQIIGKTYQKIRHEIYSIFRQACIAEDTCDDMVQDVFEKILGLDIIIEDQLKGLAVQIAYQKRTDYLRHRALINKVHNDSLWRMEQSYSNTEAEVNDILQAEMRTILSMSEKDARIYQMTRFEEKTADEIAMETGLTKRAVESRIYRARTMVRDTVKRAVGFFVLVFLFSMSMTPACAQAPATNTDRGFVHPGGLHTQEDFNRVKLQLAAGNTKVYQAYNKLKNAEYAQPSVQTYPTEVIVRGGSGENYMNAARGAAMAYQNALRWKIENNKSCANAAVRILMAWATTTKSISGDTNFALAAGLYGYQFAQAAELMRDYKGWSHEDFETFKTWMLTVWYPANIDFLRRRNGTWENASKWWQAPGHYWSNWGLCNLLCVATIGVLCDDVFIYNQGMSFFKYDQCGTYQDIRTEVPIKNDGLAEFLGNFVVTTYPSELETGAYGLLGQLNESGRDAGHSSMSLGLALDVCKLGWNQGDDLFSYMDHRMAAGIEYLAAQSLSIEGLPWVDYIRADNGIYYTDSRAWTMTAPAMGAQMRPYWGVVIGLYESVKGVSMPFAEQAYANMGIDGGGSGSTSGGYDHLGYSVLMNTHDVQLCPSGQVPTELQPLMVYGGTVNVNLIPSLAQEQTRNLVNGNLIRHSELGGLVNTFNTNNATGVPAGTSITLMPQLPEGDEDTGNWLWNTGDTTRNLSITANQSYIYRVSYTNQNGVVSQLAFSIFVQGDCLPDSLIPSSTYDGTTTTDTIVHVLYGKTCRLSVTPSCGWGTYRWNSGQTTQTITTPAIREEKTYTVTYSNQGGATSSCTFHVIPIDDEASITSVGATAPVSLRLQDDVAHDLSGRSVSGHHLLRGIYLMGGRKILTK